MLNRVLPVEARPDSIPFPDNYADWTPEHHNSVWGGDVRGMLVDLLADASRDEAFIARLAAPSAQLTQHTTHPAAALENAAVNA